MVLMFVFVTLLCFFFIFDLQPHAAHFVTGQYDLVPEKQNNNNTEQR